MMLDKENASAVAKLSSDNLGSPQFLTKPDRDGLAKSLKRSRGGLKITGENAVELGKRLIIENNIVNVLNTEILPGEAKSDGLQGKFRVMFYARESFFKRRRFQNAVAYKSSSGVVIEAGDTENIHIHSALMKGSIPIEVAHPPFLPIGFIRFFLTQRIVSKESQNQAERQKNHQVKEGNQQLSLKPAYRPSGSLPDNP
jgi:hypothetical protein